MKSIYSILAFAFTLLAPVDKAFESTGKTQIDTPDGGKLTVLTVHTKNRQTDIVLSKTNRKGNEEWVKYYGGNGYDYASDLIRTGDGGYLILGLSLIHI